MMTSLRTPDASARQVEVELKAAVGAASGELRVEAPEGWWLKTAPDQADAGRDCFTLTIGDKPKDAALPIALRLTLTGGAGAMETTVEVKPKT